MTDAFVYECWVKCVELVLGRRFLGWKEVSIDLAIIIPFCPCGGVGLQPVPGDEKADYLSPGATPRSILTPVCWKERRLGRLLKGEKTRTRWTELALPLVTTPCKVNRPRVCLTDKSHLCRRPEQTKLSHHLRLFVREFVNTKPSFQHLRWVGCFFTPHSIEALRVCNSPEVLGACCENYEIIGQVSSTLVKGGILSHTYHVRNPLTFCLSWRTKTDQ